MSNAVLGGALIGSAAALLFVFNGRIAGVSGVFGGLLTPRARDADWRAVFTAGLLLGGLIGLFAISRDSIVDPRTPVPLLIASGLLVGFGTRLANGCTSGHGVCGIGRLSKRSFVAVITFMASGMLTVYVMRHVIGVAR